MNRREFFVRSAAWGSVSLGVQSETFASPSAGPDRAAISSWSFHDLFAATRDEHSPPLSGAAFDVMTFPEMLADQYKVHAMEVVAPHFASTDDAYLREFKARLERAHSQLVNIPVDIPELERGGGLSDANEEIRIAAITACKKWIDVAASLGARSVRCDPGKMEASRLALTASSYQALASYGRSRGIYVLIENHGGRRFGTSGRTGGGLSEDGFAGRGASRFRKFP